MGLGAPDGKGLTVFCPFARISDDGPAGELPHHCSMRHGYTLLEMVVTLTLIALLTAVAAPALVAAADQSAVRFALEQLRALHGEARLAAYVEDQVALLTVTSDSITLRVIESGDTTLRWTRAGPSSWGVTYAGPSRKFSFVPAGYSSGLSNTTITLTRGSASGSLVISKFGRVRMTVP